MWHICLYMVFDSACISNCGISYIHSPMHECFKAGFRDMRHAFTAHISFRLRRSKLRYLHNVSPGFNQLFNDQSIVCDWYIWFWNAPKIHNYAIFGFADVILLHMNPKVSIYTGKLYQYTASLTNSFFKVQILRFTYLTVNMVCTSKGERLSEEELPTRSNYHSLFRFEL